jgi:hypothetical protein
MPTLIEKGGGVYGYVCMRYLNHGLGDCKARLLEGFTGNYGEGKGGGGREASMGEIVGGKAK